MSEVLKIAVISDLHVNDGEKVADDMRSWISMRLPENAYSNPLYDLKMKIVDDGLSADMLIFLGDLSERYNLNCINYAWDKVIEIGDMMTCEFVIGTVGNHDVDSRMSDGSFSPYEGIKEISPRFPYKDENCCDRYWSRYYSINVISDKVRVLNINSCAFHGYKRGGEEEYFHGRVSPNTLKKIKEELQLGGMYDINIAMFHHHPVRWAVKDEESDEMAGADKLIELIGGVEFGSWIVFHGHRHWPNIMNLHGGSNCPIVFSSGSFSSKRLAENARYNHFYIISIFDKEFDEGYSPIVGNIKSWSWNVGVGWHESGFDEGLPYGAGFGYKFNLFSLAKQMYDYMKSCGEPYYTWEQVLLYNDGVRYMMPRDIKDLLDLLVRKYGVDVLYGRNGWPLEISLRKI